MANIKSNGCIFDSNLIVETGTTITAGSLIWCDISGTNVVRPVRSYSGVTPETQGFAAETGRGIVSLDISLGLNTGVFLGVMAKTQTGVAGSQTGISWYTDGVFQFLCTPTASAEMRIGYPVYAVSRDTVRAAWTGINATPSNATGVSPIGICSFIAGTGLHASGAGSRVYVKLMPHRTMQSFA